MKRAQPVEASTLKRAFRILGPGLITGASDDDPSGIGTYSMAGASLGFVTLWAMTLTLPLMIVVQYICGKIGLVSGRGLAGVLKRHYSRTWLYPVVIGLIIANTINAGVDIAAIAAAINIFAPIPILALVFPVAGIILVVQVWGSYRLISKTFKWLTLTLFAYVGAALLATRNWGPVIKATFVPTFRYDNQYLTTLVAILGTTISPYLFFWQASEEVEEEINMGRKRLRQRKGASNPELKSLMMDTVVGMILSNVVSYFVILASASTLHAAGRTNIQSASEAAEALRPVAGNAAALLFALGIVGSGFLAVPILTSSAAYAVAETFSFKYGLNEKPSRAKQFYIVIAVSTIVGVLINFVGVNPITALFWTAVINGVLAPPMLLLIMLVARNKRVMGTRINNRVSNLVGWATTALLFLAALGMIITWKS
jgi:NRAMP (natural resistance-associated macrophage protein)-like metal ion transporter